MDPDDYPYNSGGVYRFHDHFDAPHGPNGSSYIHPDDRVIENNGPEETIRIDRTDDFLNNDKINCTYEQLRKGTSISKILIDFFGENAIFDVQFNVQTNLVCDDNPDASGCTTDLGGNKYRVDIDLDYAMDPETPTLFIAQTLIHEAIHANLFAEAKRVNHGEEPRNKDFKSLYNKYRENKGWSHEVMAQKYTIVMKKALKEVHPHLNDQAFIDDENTNTLWDWDRFYEVLSYRGLDDTEAGADFYAQNLQEISLYTEDAKANSTPIPVNCDE